MDGQTREEKLQSIGRVLDAEPSLNKWAMLLRDYATSKGGLTLRFWQLHRGALFQDPNLDPDPRKVEDVASILNVPVSSLVKIMGETRDAVLPVWESSPEHQEELKIQEAKRRAASEARNAGAPNKAQKPKNGG
jgi:hypothetical protein